MPFLSTIINACSRDFPFLPAAIKQAKRFSDEVFVILADHFFDGRQEDYTLIKRAAQSFPQATFYLYALSSKTELLPFYNQVGANNYWHNVSRFVGYSKSSQKSQWNLFLDVDEIVDAALFTEWFSSFDLSQLDVGKLANHWYFRSVDRCATTLEDSAVLIRKQLLTPALFFDKEERNALYDCVKTEKKKRMIQSLHKTPMVHHYSWVRSKETMLSKVRSWGHRDDRDWESLVEKEFNSSNAKKDFVHGYTYRTVDPFITLEEIPAIEVKEEPKNLHILHEEQLLSLLPKQNLFASLKEKIAIFSSRR